jgi:hypothetical protein
VLILGGVHCSFYCHPFLSSSQTPFPLEKGVKASNLVFKVPETSACVQLFQGAVLVGSRFTIFAKCVSFLFADEPSYTLYDETVYILIYHMLNIGRYENMSFTHL